MKIAKKLMVLFVTLMLMGACGGLEEANLEEGPNVLGGDPDVLKGDELSDEVGHLRQASWTGCLWQPPTSTTQYTQAPCSPALPMLDQVWLKPCACGGTARVQYDISSYLGVPNTCFHFDIACKCIGNLPIGWLDGVVGGVAYGWTCDRDNPAASIGVQINVEGSMPIHGTANLPSEAAVNSLCHGGAAHRFAVPIGNVAPGTPVRAYGVDIGACPFLNPGLSGNPRPAY